jgi:hypothetical protein
MYGNFLVMTPVTGWSVNLPTFISATVINTFAWSKLQIDLKTTLTALLDSFTKIFLERWALSTFNQHEAGGGCPDQRIT